MWQYSRKFVFGRDQSRWQHIYVLETEEKRIPFTLLMSVTHTGQRDTQYYIYYIVTHTGQQDTLPWDFQAGSLTALCFPGLLPPWFLHIVTCILISAMPSLDTLSSSSSNQHLWHKDDRIFKRPLTPFSFCKTILRYVREIQKFCKNLIWIGTPSHLQDFFEVFRKFIKIWKFGRPL